MKRVALLGLILLAACTPEEEPCPEGAFLSVALVHPDSLHDINALGNVNPTGHTFPTDHMYFHVIRDAQDRPIPLNLHCPGDMKLVYARAVEHVNAGHLDFALDLEACGDMRLVLGHVAELDENLFAGFMNFDSWNFAEEYSTGGETFRVHYIEPNWDVPAGTRLGRVGVEDFQFGFDVGFYDWTRSSPTTANSSRWGDYGYLKAFSILDYYPEGEIKDAFAAKITRETYPGDPYPFGRVMQDVPGTAQGCWFLPGASFPPEDEHLALVVWNAFPSKNVFSIGAGLPSLSSGIYPFAPDRDGMLNAPFADIGADGQTHAWHLGPDWTPSGWIGTILVHMPDEETLWIEGIEGTIENPADWNFTAAKTIFQR